MRLLQPVGEHERLVTEKSPGRALGHDSSLVDQYDTAAELDNQLQVVGSDDAGRWEAAKERFQFPFRARVKVARRFIKHKDLGPAREDPCQTDPPLLATAEVVRHPVLKAFQADCPQGALHQGLHLLFPQSKLRGPEGDVFEDSRTEELIVGILKEEPDAPVNLPRAISADRDAAHPDGRRWRIGLGEKPVQMQQER